MFPGVLRALLDRVPDGRPAEVAGWRAAALPGRVYPVLVPAEGARATGLLLTGVGVADWRILDAYEDDLYALERLPLTGGGHAWTYVSPGGVDVLPEDWSADVFAEGYLPSYVTACEEWRAEYETGRTTHS
ncbi:gamma-glutamylcyclotransferase family protein [Yinghuangia seranimata]|uniref:gamma-glutamylcyclotransferase family protein n=1 Tax=Yinghuangia seranimata TaxID=408067 RepID=UPI00248CC712|nr:gamma-glutamylcyclotransferase family protein [Yinghuangia seranimata]MDI2132066.1 gamma-glutamylcyclotransferase [Yinghuangia seranimata]